MRRSQGVSALTLVIAMALIALGMLAIVGWDTTQAAKADRACQPVERDIRYEKDRIPDCGPRK